MHLIKHYFHLRETEPYNTVTSEQVWYSEQKVYIQYSCKFHI